MVKRKQLKGIAYSIAYTFCSRNNDIDGYWAMGLLYKAALDHSAQSISIDLIDRSSQYPGSGFCTMARAYCNYMDQIAVNRGLSIYNIEAAEITVEFDSSKSFRPFNAPSGFVANYYVCSVVIVDDLGISRAGCSAGWCFPHSPELGLVHKSTGGDRYHHLIENSGR